MCIRDSCKGEGSILFYYGITDQMRQQRRQSLLDVQLLDIHRAAEKYLVGKPSVSAVLGPYLDAEMPRDQWNIETVSYTHLDVYKRQIKKYSSSASLYSIYVSVGSHLYLNETDTDIHKIASAIQSKIHKLHEDNSVLCFKEDCFVEDEMLQKSGEELTKSVEGELDNWKDLNGGESEIEFNFELVSPFPRYNVPIDKETAIVDCSQLWPNGNLLVEFFKEESDDEESDEEPDEDENE